MTLMYYIPRKLQLNFICNLQKRIISAPITLHYPIIYSGDKDLHFYFTTSNNSLLMIAG